MAIGLTACSSTVEPTSAQLPANLPSPVATSWDGPGDVHAHLPTPTTDPDRSQAKALAATVMELFARPNVPADKWWKELAVHLTPQAQHDYDYTDPANVPATTVTGPAVVHSTDSNTLARIQVPTDVGLYLVILTRSPESPQWLVDRLLPPELNAGEGHH